jgi:effector-binding domain-containing protein
MDEVNIVDVESKIVVGLRKRGKYKMISEMIPDLFEFIGESGSECVGSPIFVCHEKTEEEWKVAEETGTADLEVVIPVAKKMEDIGEYKFYELPGGKMAKILHKGPYEKVGGAYSRLFAWLGKNGKKIIGPIREVYTNDPREVPAKDIMTEIYAPIG